MNDQSHKSTTPDHDQGACEACQDLLGAYVLQALDQFDRGIVEQHLRWCESCRAEADALESISTGLALATQNVGAPSPRTWSAIQARLASDEAVEHSNPVAVVSTRTTAAPRWFQWLPISVITPLMLVIIVLGAWGLSVQNDLDETTAELANHALLNSTLTNSQQVQLYSMEQSCPTCEGVGQIGVSQSSGMGMVVGWDFDPSITHDVWGIDHNGERSRVCKLLVAKDGAVMQMFHFPDSPSRFTDIYVTDESGRLVYTSHIVDDDPELPLNTAQT